MGIGIRCYHLNFLLRPSLVYYTLDALIGNRSQRSGVYLIKVDDEAFRESYQVFIHNPTGSIDTLKNDILKVFQKQCLSIIEHEDYFIVGVR